MTIAVALKVNDGIVLAADSASTILGEDPTAVENVYNNANKIYNLRKGLPIGLMTWGLGGIGGASTSTLAKDLRRRFTDPLEDHQAWRLDDKTYTVEHVADRVREFFYDERYKPAADATIAAVNAERQKEIDAAVETGADPPDFPDDDLFPTLGFIVAGYSPAEPHAEEYLLELGPEECRGPTLLTPGEQSGISWAGQPEAITRLVRGHGLELGDVLVQDFGLPEDEVGDALMRVGEVLGAPLVNPAMPFQDAIDLAEFLVDVSIQWSRFMPGSPTVGGPIETAAISKHEGFKWVKRKHYFSASLNPEVDR